MNFISYFTYFVLSVSFNLKPIDDAYNDIQSLIVDLSKKLVNSKLEVNSKVMIMNKLSASWNHFMGLSNDMRQTGFFNINHSRFDIDTFLVEDALKTIINERNLKITHINLQKIITERNSNKTHIDQSRKRPNTSSKDHHNWIEKNSLRHLNILSSIKSESPATGELPTVAEFGFVGELFGLSSKHMTNINSMAIKNNAEKIKETASYLHKSIEIMKHALQASNDMIRQISIDGGSGMQFMLSALSISESLGSMGHVLSKLLILGQSLDQGHASKMVFPLSEVEARITEFKAKNPNISMIFNETDDLYRNRLVYSEYHHNTQQIVILFKIPYTYKDFTNCVGQDARVPSKNEILLIKCGNFAAAIEKKCLYSHNYFMNGKDYTVYINKICYFQQNSVNFGCLTVNNTDFVIFNHHNATTTFDHVNYDSEVTKISTDNSIKLKIPPGDSFVLHSYPKLFIIEKTSGVKHMGNITFSVQIVKNNMTSYHPYLYLYNYNKSFNDSINELNYIGNELSKFKDYDPFDGLTPGGLVSLGATLVLAIFSTLAIIFCIKKIKGNNISKQNVTLDMELQEVSPVTPVVEGRQVSEFVTSSQKSKEKTSVPSCNIAPTKSVPTVPDVEESQSRATVVSVAIEHQDQSPVEGKPLGEAATGGVSAATKHQDTLPVDEEPQGGTKSVNGPHRDPGFETMDKIKTKLHGF